MSNDSGEEVVLMPMIIPVTSMKLLNEAAAKHGRSVQALLSEAIKDKIAELDKEFGKDEEGYPWTS
jgi:hypothetical protein